MKLGYSTVYHNVSLPNVFLILISNGNSMLQSLVVSSVKLNSYNLFNLFCYNYIINYLIDIQQVV